MKKYDYKKSTKDYKSILSPVSQKPQIFFGQDLFKDFEKNKLALSHKKSQDELLLTKQKGHEKNIVDDGADDSTIRTASTNPVS